MTLIIKLYQTLLIFFLSPYIKKLEYIVSNKQKLKNRLQLKYAQGYFIMQIRNILYSQMVAELTTAIDNEIINQLKNKI